MYFLAVTYSLPSTASMINEIGSSSAPFLTEYLPLMLFLAGILLVGSVIWLILDTIGNLFNRH